MASRRCADSADVRPGGVRRTRSQSGFTLLEMMIALAIIAIVAVAVIGHGGDTVRHIGTLEQRTLARYVAQDEIARLRLERLGADEPIRTGTRRSRVLRGERAWWLVRETSATQHPWLRRVEVTVYAVDGGREVGPVDTLVAFVGRY